MDNEIALQKELEKLAKESNKRIRALQKVTGIQYPFAVKELRDLLSSSTVKGYGAKGVIYSPDLTETQKQAIIKATKNFLESGASTVAEVRAIAKNQAKLTGKKMTLRFASTLYNIGRDWKYYQEKYNLPSDFWQSERKWNVASHSLEEFEKWIETYITVEKDTTVKRDIQALYLYLKG